MNTILSTTTADRLARFATAVRDSPHNLLSKRGLDELEQRHLPECVAFAELIPVGARVLDLGTGGGFPGMVIAICRPDLDVTLLDATRKKMAFLEDFAASEGVRVATLVGRAEELAREHGGRFDVVTARAVAPLDRLVPWAVPFLRPGGALLAIKGDKWADELRAAMPAVQRARARVEQVVNSSTSAEDGGTGLMPRVVIIRAPG